MRASPIVVVLSKYKLHSTTMTRKQLTLFLDPTESQAIEAIRRTFNPKQYALIKSHITLCREDEIEDLTLVKANLARLGAKQFELKADKPKRFSEGKGVFIPIVDGEGKFKALREAILQDVIAKPRDHEPHITLMHPRNSTCDDRKFQEILQIKTPATFSISKISFIEQEMGKLWRILDEFELKNEENP